MKSGFESLQRFHLQAILLLLVVFLIGAVVGVAFQRAQWGRWHGSGRPPSPGRLPPELSEGLNLRPEQERAIDEILKTFGPKTDEVMADCLPRMEALRDSAFAQVRALLDPDQRRILDERKDRRGRGPHPLWGSRPGEPPPGPSGEMRDKGGPPQDGGADTRGADSPD